MSLVPPASFRAVLWDCDGVLIDSEILACSAAVEVFNAHGIAVTLEDFIERFMGKSRVQVLSELKFEGVFPEDGVTERKNALFRAHLKAIPGVEDVLRAIAPTPMAVASGSDPDRLALTLGLTGLAGYFGPHVYSSESVARGKPAPDIFLFAAEKLGVAPRDCLVIEDSPHGIKAAQAAGMPVYAFTGGSHITPRIRQSLAAAQPNALFGDMIMLLQAVQAA